MQADFYESNNQFEVYIGLKGKEIGELKRLTTLEVRITNHNCETLNELGREINLRAKISWDKQNDIELRYIPGYQIYFLEIGSKILDNIKDLKPFTDFKNFTHVTNKVGRAIGYRWGYRDKIDFYLLKSEPANCN